MSTTANQVTIESLKEIVGDDAICRTTTTSEIEIFGWKALAKMKACQRKAVATILLTCSAHGTNRYAVCRLHLWLLRQPAGSYELSCGSCNQPAVWKGL